MFEQYLRYWRSTEIIHAYGLGQYFERTLVWILVWNSSGQLSDSCLIRGHFCLELVCSEVASIALRPHNDLLVHTHLIRGHFGLGWSDQGQFRARPQPGREVFALQMIQTKKDNVPFRYIITFGHFAKDFTEPKQSN